MCPKQSLWRCQSILDQGGGHGPCQQRLLLSGLAGAPAGQVLKWLGSRHLPPPGGVAWRNRQIRQHRSSQQQSADHAAHHHGGGGRAEQDLWRRQSVADLCWRRVSLITTRCRRPFDLGRRSSSGVGIYAINHRAVGMRIRAIIRLAIPAPICRSRRSAITVAADAQSKVYGDVNPSPDLCGDGLGQQRHAERGALDLRRPVLGSAPMRSTRVRSLAPTTRSC